MAVFPGRHSVLWERTVGLGISMVVKAWEGTKHVDCGGNVRFIEGSAIDTIMNAVADSLKPDTYEKMRSKALLSKDYFSYYQIAKRSLGI